jgi:hypothetical protein
LRKKGGFGGVILGSCVDFIVVLENIEELEEGFRV